MISPRLTPLVERLPALVPFVGPEAQERARKTPFATRLGANESAFGPSPRAIEAMAKAAADAWMYGDPESYELRHALASSHQVDPNNIVIGEGIDGLLGTLIRLMIGPGDAVVTSEGAYPTFNYHATGFGGTLHKVPYRNDHEDPDALLDMARQTGAKLVYLSNPDNPMGTWHSGATVQKMIEQLPAETLLILDEAYVELAPDDTAPPWAPDTPNLIRLRTFSKAYGLAGARIGYAVGPRNLIQSFNKVRNHFGVNRIGQAAALAALQDNAWLLQVRQDVATARAEINAIAAKAGLGTLPSATNFVAIDCGGDGDLARRVLSNLIEAGIFVRMPIVAPQDRAIRVACAPSHMLAPFAAALPAALESAMTP